MRKKLYDHLGGLRHGGYIKDWSDGQLAAWAQKRLCPATGQTVEASWLAEQPRLRPLPGALPLAFDVALTRTAAEHTRRFASGEYQLVEVDGGHWLPETRADDVADVVLENLARTR